MTIKINLSRILAILGGLGVFAPDVAGFATYLSSIHIGWLQYVVRGLGLLAAFFAAAPIVVPRLRAFLALLGLATAPGAQAPWDPARDKGVQACPPPAPLLSPVQTSVTPSALVVTAVPAPAPPVSIANFNAPVKEKV